jgi:hypothetical protein
MANVDSQFILISGCMCALMIVIIIIMMVKEAAACCAAGATTATCLAQAQLPA